MTDLIRPLVGEEHVDVPLENLRPAKQSGEGGNPTSIRCPHCGDTGVFQGGSGNTYASAIANSVTSYHVVYWMGVRICPNTECGSPVFLIEQDARVLLTYPPRTIDFNAQNLPELIKASLEEAIRAHASQCYKASALMVRRTLEEVCKDRGATGRDLKKRLEDLRGKITLPAALFEAMDNLRLLGNDAAHVEAQTYDDIGENETEIAIELTKEIVKASYQYDDLLSKLRGLQKQGE